MSLDTAVTLGLFDWVDADGVREPGQLYRERLDLLAEGEAQGFDIYHLAEHHGTPLGLVPSPSVFLAAAAMRTTRIRLCPLVYVLPLYHPARLAEEIAMLDQLSEGRLEIGFGKGGNPYELLAYGIEPGDAQRRYDENLDAVLRILRTGTIDAASTTTGATTTGATTTGATTTGATTTGATTTGATTTGATTAGGAPMPLRTRQSPGPPVWYPSANPESVPQLGKRGINTILGFSFRSPTIEITRLRRDDYFNGAAQAPPGTAMGGAGVRTPRFGIMRNVYVGESDGHARERAVAAMQVFYEQFITMWRRHGDDRFREAQDFARAIDEGRVIAGSAATVRARLTEIMRASGCNHFAGAFAFGTLSYAEARASLVRFGEQVAPALRGLAPG